MIILHGTWDKDLFILWGETPPEASAKQRPRRGRRPKVLRPAPLPYDAGKEGLLSATKEVLPGSRHKKAEISKAMIWLPSLSGIPFPSSSIIADPPQGKGRTRLLPWLVTSLPLDMKKACDFLLWCSGRQMLCPGLKAADDIDFWCQALRFASALVARQMFLPGLAVKNGRYRAVWEPVYLGQESERLSKLSKEMPPVARALSFDKGGSIPPPQIPEETLLREFIQAAVDHLVRSSLKPSQRIGSNRGRRLRFDSIHDQWLYALQSREGLMEADELELAGFANQVSDWQMPVALSANAPFRLCFRLREPGEGRNNDKWRVEYLLQDVSDPSLLVKAREALELQKRRSSVLRRKGFDPREFLLSALGQASRICPHIEKSLEAPAPEGYELDGTGAHQFLTEKASALSMAGFSVLLPAWWTGKGAAARMAVRAVARSPKMKASSGLGLSALVEFNWELALGGRKLSLSELRELARLKSPLVKIRGQWVEVRPEEIQKAIELLEKKSQKVPVFDVIRMAIGASRDENDLMISKVHATGWVGQLLNRLEGKARFEELAPPKGFSGRLRPYQLRGYSWLAFLSQWGLGACLADDMGLGKTIQTLAFIQQRVNGNGDAPVLIVCPTTVLNNWQKEAERFTPALSAIVHHGTDRMKGETFVREAQKHVLVISSYALLHRDLAFLKRVPWAGVVLDEAQNIKNPETKQSRAARALPAGFRIALTGTPMENHVGELWSIMEFLNPGLLRHQAAFKREFFIPIQLNRDPEATRRLKRLTGPFILRRLKTDPSVIQDLPEKMEMKVFCSMSKEQVSLYAAVLRELEEGLKSAEGIQRKGLILSTLTKLKQVCNHPAQFMGDRSRIAGRSGKLTRLTEILEELVQTGDHALVFSQFAEMGQIIQTHLQEVFGIEVPFLHGRVPKKKRDKIVEYFQSESGPPVFVLSLKAGGLGLNLTRANHVFHFDRWWNPAVENQATDRAFRIGQRRNVQVRKFVCAGTLEEKIDAMLEKKKDLADLVVGTGEGWLTELSNEELREIFSLREDIICE